MVATATAVAEMAGVRLTGGLSVGGAVLLIPVAVAAAVGIRVEVGAPGRAVGNTAAVLVGATLGSGLLLVVGVMLGVEP